MIKYDNAPAYMTYQSNEVDTEESFEKTFGIHVKASVLKGLLVHTLITTTVRPKPQEKVCAY